MIINSIILLIKTLLEKFFLEKVARKLLKGQNKIK